MGTQRNEVDKLQSELGIRRTKKGTGKTGGKTQRGERSGLVGWVKTN